MVEAATPQKRAASCKVLFAQLSDYLDEQLDDSLCEKLEEHLDGCERCKVFLNSLEATIMQLRQLPSERSTRRKAPKFAGMLCADIRRC